MDGSVFSWWMKEISELSKRNEALCCLHLFLYALHDLWSLKTHKYQCIGCCSTEQKYECQLLKNNTNNINIFSIPKYSTYFMPRHENLDCIPSASLQGVSTIDCSTSNWQRSCSQNIDYCKVIIVLPPKWSDWENLIRNFVRLGDIASASQSPHRLQIAGKCHFRNSRFLNYISPDSLALV
jgi:hypothetical protein